MFVAGFVSSMQLYSDSVAVYSVETETQTAEVNLQ